MGQKYRTRIGHGIENWVDLYSSAGGASVSIVPYYLVKLGIFEQGFLSTR